VGLTHLPVRIANVADQSRSAELTMLLDLGALYSVVPATLLTRLGVRPDRTEVFTLADGSTIRGRVGFAAFEVHGRRAPSTVIFGRAGDAALLGAVALEELGLMLDPLRRDLKPLRLRLGALAS
jgi:predicted aspartyl protease